MNVSTPQVKWLQEIAVRYIRDVHQDIRLLQNHFIFLLSARLQAGFSSHTAAGRPSFLWFPICLYKEMNNVGATHIVRDYFNGKSVKK